MDPKRSLVIPGVATGVLMCARARSRARAGALTRAHVSSCARAMPSPCTSGAPLLSGGPYTLLERYIEVREVGGWWYGEVFGTLCCVEVCTDPLSGRYALTDPQVRAQGDHHHTTVITTTPP